MSHQFPSVGPSSVGGLVTGTSDVQASTVMERDSNSDTNLNVLYAAKGVRTAGHLYTKFLAKSASFSVDENSNNAVIYGVTTGASTLTGTLESATGVTNKLVIFQKADSGAGSLVIDPDGSETFGGTTSYALYRQYDRVMAVSNGTNYDVIAEPTVLSSAVAASTTVSNTTTETTFSTSGLSLAANTLRAGDIIEVELQGIATATNSTDTLTINLELGTTTIVTTGAVDVVTNDLFHVRALIQVRTVGASGTIVATGTQALGTSGTVTAKPFLLASTTLDTTAAVTVNATATWSVASASNSVRLDVFAVKRFRN